MTCDRSLHGLLLAAALVAAGGCQDLLPEREAAPRTSASYSSNRTSVSEEETLHELASRIARQHGLDPALATEVVAVESNWNPRAVSPKGARGLMQLMPGTARAEFGLRDGESLYDPRVNLRLGVAHLATLLARYCDVRLALWAWHAGEGRVDPDAGRISPGTSRRFVRKVLTRYRARGGDPEAVPVEGCESEPPVRLTEEPTRPEVGYTASEDPKPLVTSAWASALQTRVGEPVDLRLEAENLGGLARGGRLVVTLAEHPPLRLGFRSNLKARFSDDGSSQGVLSGTRQRPDPATVTAESERWAAGERHYLHLRLVPAETGTIVLTYRLTLEGTHGTLHRYPETSVHRLGTQPGRRVEIHVTRTLTGGNR